MDTPTPSPDQIDLAAFLATRDAPCPVCGYNLRSLLTDRCPECGRHLVLAVGTTEPKLGAFILGLVGWALGLGFCGIVLVWGMTLVIVGAGGPNQNQIIMLAIGTVISGLGVWVWIRTRKPVSRLPGWARMAAAAGSVVASILIPVWFILTVR